MKRREPRMILHSGAGHSNIHLLNFLDDRWIISIPLGGLTVIWDTREDPPKLYKCTSDSLQGGVWDAAVTVDPCQGDIIIAVTQ